MTENHFFCRSWASAHWHDTLEPALVQHVRLTGIAVGIGFALSLAAALLAYRLRRFEGSLTFFAGFLYTVPSLALFQLLVPITGLSVTTVEIALVSYTLVILFRNILEGLRGVPPDVLEAARGMGLTRVQTLARVELPLALPAIVAGLRVAVVSTISIATVAAYVVPQGLGAPIFVALGSNVFKTEIIAAGALAIVLALAADGALVLVQRLLTPWARLERSR